MIPPTRAGEEELRELAVADARSAAATRRPARPAGREPHRGAAAARARRATRPGRHPRGPGGDPRLRRAPNEGGARRRFPTARTRRPTCSRAPPREQDIELRVTARLEGDSLELDFSGTSAQIEGNLNCPLAVTKSAAYFAVKVVCDPDGPPSAGAFRPISVLAPEGSLLNAQAPAAVAAGNVETSSRVADLVLGALAGATPVPAQGQGTMNNLTLAGEGWTYYETIAGGQGACPDADGPSAVHVAMSNTLNTPVEALEAEYPVRVRELALRRGSGGAGHHRRRRRGGARDRGARADAIHADHRAPSPLPKRARRRRGRGGGPQLAQRGRATGEGDRRAAPGRPPANRDAGGRWLRGGLGSRAPAWSVIRGPGLAG